MRLRSADPADKPAIQPNYLSTDEDRRVAAEFDPRHAPHRARSRRSRRSSRTNICPGQRSRDDDEAALVKAAGDIGTTIFHPVGTAKMGRAERSDGGGRRAAARVRPRGLRVIDASVMPTITSGNTNSPTIMIAEKGAAMILRGREVIARRHDAAEPIAEHAVDAFERPRIAARRKIHCVQCAIGRHSMTDEFLLLLAIGFLAQMVDGALGMAFGVVSTSAMLAIGLPPAQASALVHTAEVFTTGASAASHIYHRNVDWRLVSRLGIAGVLGAVLGAWVLSNVDATCSAPFVFGYLLLMGVYILLKAVRIRDAARRAGGLDARRSASSAGFLDASGGGGWGPVATSTLVGSGHAPRQTVGSVNATEFFVTVAAATTFFVELGASPLQHLVPLVLGGLIAAPFGGWVVKHIPARTLMIARRPADPGAVVVAACAARSVAARVSALLRQQHLAAGRRQRRHLQRRRGPAPGFGFSAFW